MNVGDAIAAALARAKAHEALSTRKLRVRFLFAYGNDDSCLTMVAHIAAHNAAELEAQAGKGVRRVPWAELDERANELEALVDEIVAEIDASVNITPSN
jgi:hypothetical protein